MDVATFREIQPRFADTTLYSDTRVQFYLNQAAINLLPTVWKENLPFGTVLYVSHFLALNSPRLINGQLVYGSTTPTGLQSSKSVGGASVSYDVNVGMTEGGGTFNLTTYGQEFLTLMRSVTTGVIQL